MPGSGARITYGHTVRLKQDDPLDKGVVGDWRFDRNTGLILPGADGFGNNGVVTGANWEAGPKGLCLNFDANTEVVVVPDSVSLTLTTNLTLEVLFRCDANPSADWARILSKAQGAGSDDYSLTVAPVADALPRFASRINTDIATTTSVIAQATLRLEYGQWYHYIVTWDKIDSSGANIRAYIDGRYWAWDAGGDNVGTLDATGDDLGIGRHATSNTRHLTGKVAFARVYNQTLTPREARDRYTLSMNKMHFPIAINPTGLPFEAVRIPRNPAIIYQVPAIV